MSLVLWVLGFAALGACARVYIFSQREKFINRYVFPVFLTQKLQQQYPQLTHEQTGLVIKGLRQYFLMCCKAEKKLVAMPSQVVDELWHQFILHTRAYQVFCRKGLGRFLHHTPAEAMKGKKDASDSIKRAWRLACKIDGINPKKPERLPLIFALDTMLAIPGGFNYALDCTRSRTGEHCASHIGCGGGCSGSSGCSGDSGCGGD
ncbi:MAG: hypothetical protein B0W54_03610 [Cellvibrio sp. 79]|nr:MAG: hypothetical protein B0W54_03610 [Cellvibrio sp. 79]